MPRAWLNLTPCRPGECYEILVESFGQEGDYLLSMTCIIATDVPVQCGDTTSGSTVGLQNLRGFQSGDQLHLFCPTETGTALVGTCESDFDTELYINGPDVDISCDDDCNGYPPCGNDDLKENALFDFKAGACYDIIVGGYGDQEGNYALSILCANRNSSKIDIACGSNISGSIRGVQSHRFCPNETGRVQASTCGSNFDAMVYTIDPTAQRLDNECGDGCNAACIEFGFRPGREIERGGGWFAAT